MQRLETYYHPGVVAFHLFIKAALLTTYLLCELLNHGAFVINFVLVVLLQAVDFWYVKVTFAAPRGACGGCGTRAQRGAARKPRVGSRHALTSRAVARARTCATSTLPRRART